ncbi:hypothetical protein [Bartonella sp. B1099]|uniref:hypothetical protein n=1 Tax=Bartonella sp. B1099 TaxID=2911422 RepID=UPI0020C2DBEC|nr:hypothetical protein [Bartonella sp. B1099]
MNIEKNLLKTSIERAITNLFYLGYVILYEAYPLMKALPYYYDISTAAKGQNKSFWLLIKNSTVGDALNLTTKIFLCEKQV